MTKPCLGTTFLASGGAQDLQRAAHSPAGSLSGAQAALAAEEGVGSAQTETTRSRKVKEPNSGNRKL